MLLSFCNMASYAYDFEVDGLYYNLVSASENTCELVGYKGNPTSVTIPLNVNTRGISLSVIGLKEESFLSCNTLKELIVLAPIDIPVSAFEGCSSLTDVILSNGVKTISNKAFYNCPIDSLYIPNTISRIGEESVNLVKTIYIEDGKTTLDCGGNAKSLRKIYIGRNMETGSWYYEKNKRLETFKNTSLCSNTPIESVEIGPLVTKISKSQFQSCYLLKHISIPRNVNIVESNAFKKSSLNAIDIEDGDTPLKLEISYEDIIQTWSSTIVLSWNKETTGKGPFDNVPLQSVYIGRNILYAPYSFSYLTPGGWCNYVDTSPVEGVFSLKIIMEDYSLFSHNSLENVTFGPKVTTLCNYMFENQKNASVLHVPNSITVIEDHCFEGSAISQLEINSNNVIIGENAFSGCNLLSKISLRGVKSLGNDCFINCTGLKNVELGNDIESIGRNSFRGCSSLHRADLGGLQTLPEGTFAECYSFNWILMGENLSNIEKGALSDCKNLYAIGLKTQTPPTFSNSSELAAINKFDATIYIPNGTTSAYDQASVWKDFLFKEEKPIPEFVFTLPKPDESSFTQMTVRGDLTGETIKKINTSTLTKLNLKDAVFALSKQAYYSLGERIVTHLDDVDVVRKAPYYSYNYYTAPYTATDIQKEYNSNGKVINIIYNYYCSDLSKAYLNSAIEELHLPSCLTELGKNAIQGSKLKHLYVYSTIPPKASTESFGGTSVYSCILHVPEGSGEAYKSADGWRNFSNIIETAEDNYIEVQPSSEMPMVKLAHNDELAKYQWYKYVEKTGKIVDITSLLSTNDGWETDGEKWISNKHDPNSAAKLEIEHTFNVDDELSFDWVVSSEETFDQLQCYLDDELLFVSSGEHQGCFKKKFEKAVSGKLSFIYIKDNIIDEANDNAEISNVLITSSNDQIVQTIQEISGETSNALNSGAVNTGDKIYCIVTLSTGKQLKSNEFVLEYVNFIKTQPTLKNLSVELDTPEEGATYKWYQRIETKTDSKDIVPSSSGSYPWTESNGVWTSGNYNKSSSSSTMTATIDVEAGDVLSFDWNVSSEAGYDYFYCTINGTQVLKKSGTDNGTYTKEFTTASKVTIEYKYTKDSGTNSGADCATVSNIKLTRPSGFTNVVDSEITGANTSTLDEMLIEGDATVWCVVTLSNGRILVSDKVQYKYNHALHFKKTHSDILSKTTATITISDLDAVENALSDYANLPEDAQMKLLEEKALLDALKVEIVALGFKETHSGILSMTPTTVSISDFEAVENALRDYMNLPENVQMRLQDEKNILDTLKVKIYELTTPSNIYSLILEKKDGSSEKYILSDRPEITFFNSTVVVSSITVQTDCPLDDFARFYFEENVADGISVNTASSFVFKYNDNTVRISGAEKAEIYSADGMKLLEQYATNGDIRMNISNLTQGLYVIKTNKKSIKIRK